MKLSILYERDYKREYKLYHGTPAHRKQRSDRNKARRMKGLKDGDPREVHHKNPLSRTGTNLDRNLALTRDKRAHRAEGNKVKYGRH